MTDLTDAAIDALVTDLRFLENHDVADAITALRAQIAKSNANFDRMFELCSKAQDKWNDGINEREQLKSALIGMTAERDAALALAASEYARGIEDAARVVRSSADLYASKDANFICHYASLDIEVLASAPPAPVVQVKPLVWNEGDEPDEWKSGPYDVWCEFGKFQLYYWSIVMGDPHDTAAAAKAAAQADYEARIRSARLPQAEGGAA